MTEVEKFKKTIEKLTNYFNTDTIVFEDITPYFNKLEELVLESGSNEELGETLLLLSIGCIKLKMTIEKNNSKDTYEKITNQMIDTFERKNHDYGNSFSKSIKKYGFISGLTRISDKYNRLESLITKGNQKVMDESITDTLIDMSSYCLMFNMEIL